MAAPYQGQVDTESVIQHDRGTGEGRLARPWSRARTPGIHPGSDRIPPSAAVKQRL